MCGYLGEGDAGGDRDEWRRLCSIGVCVYVCSRMYNDFPCF